MPHTRLLASASRRSDDDQILAVLEDIPGASASGRVFTAALLNEAGMLYREVELVGEYEVLQFTARMNASGFVQVRNGAVEGYSSVFCKP